MGRRCDHSVAARNHADCERNCDQALKHMGEFGSAHDLRLRLSSYRLSNNRSVIEAYDLKAFSIWGANSVTPRSRNCQQSWQPARRERHHLNLRFCPQRYMYLHIRPETSCIGKKFRPTCSQTAGSFFATHSGSPPTTRPPASGCRRTATAPWQSGHVRAAQPAA